MKLTGSIIALILFTHSISAFQSRSIWIDLKLPETTTFLNDSSFLGISGDINIAVNRHLIKLTGSYTTEEFMHIVNFTSPDLKLTHADISYGYILNAGNLSITPNISVGIAHYIARGALIPDTSGSFIKLGDKFSEIENTGAICRFPLYLNYSFTDWFGAGIHFDPFIVDAITGFNAGVFISFGKVWRAERMISRQ